MYDDDNVKSMMRMYDIKADVWYDNTTSGCVLYLQLYMYEAVERNTTQHYHFSSLTHRMMSWYNILSCVYNLLYKLIQ